MATKIGTKRPDIILRNKSEKQRLAVSIATKGRPSLLRGRKKPPLSEEWKRKISQAKKGSITWNKGLKGYNSGIKHYNWQGGITPINHKIRNSLEYKLWRKSVFERDNYTCIWCKAKSQKGKKVMLHADHIKPFALFPELRFAIDNGRTLCIDCHKTTYICAGRIKNYV